MKSNYSLVFDVSGGEAAAGNIKKNSPKKESFNI